MMPTGLERQRIAQAERLSRLAGAVAISSACLALLIGIWSSSRSVLLSPSLIPSVHTAAAAILAAGFSLRLAQPGASSRRLRGSQGLGALVAFLGVIGLATTDEMVQYTFILIFLVGLALLLLDVVVHRGFRLAEPFALMAIAGTFLALIGWIFSAKILLNPAKPELVVQDVVVLGIAIALLVLPTGILLARPTGGIISLLTSKGAGGMIARQLLPVAVLVPVIVGWLRLIGERLGLYDADFGTALFVTAVIGCFVVALWRTGRVLEQTDTERRRAEAKLRSAYGELEERVARRTAELSAANLELTQQTQENEMFVYSVSHDLRSPLVNLQGFSNELELACEDLRQLFSEAEIPEPIQERGVTLIDDEIGESVHFIQAAVMRLSSIIDALLRLSRAGRVEFRPQRIDIEEIVRRVVESLASTISEREAAVIVRELPPAWADPTAIERVFGNLIGNALNYLAPGRPGIIEIGSRSADTTECKSPCSVYYVRDNGIGIPAGSEAKVFQAFQRLHPDAAKGEGMGLAIVRRVVERHGGRIWYESVVGSGTTFFLELPAPINAKASGESMSVVGA